MDDQLYEAGLANRRRTLGDAYVDRATQNVDDFNRDFQRLVTEYCWGACWDRDALVPAERSLVTVAILAATGRWEEFDLHFRGALRNGATPDQLRDVLFHCAIYAGIPVGVSAFKRAREILAEATG